MEMLLPLEISSFSPLGKAVAVLLLGFGFGFVLERAGFGDSRNLAAQFYLHNMRVFKVMFTAIIVAMVLIFLCSSLQIIDFSRIWVNPTFVWPQIVGGLLFGVGFIIGGYCPGTALVASATWKLDGVFFSIGVAAGLFLFGEAVPAFWQWYIGSGAKGHYMLSDWLGIDPGIIVLAMTAMAIGCFMVVELVERIFTKKKQEAQK